VFSRAYRDQTDDEEQKDRDHPTLKRRLAGSAREENRLPLPSLGIKAGWPKQVLYCAIQLETKTGKYIYFYIDKWPVFFYTVVIVKKPRGMR
jgi:hypothetical protein